MADLGTAYVQVRGDLSDLNKQMVANFHPSKLSKLGKGAGLAIGVGLGAGLAAGAAGKGLFDLGAKFDSEFDKIRVGTGKTSKALDALEDDFKAVLTNTPASFGDVGTAVAELNRRLGLTGKPLRSFATQLVNLSRITGTDLSTNIEEVARAFEDWEVPIKDQTKALDGLFRLGQKSGISVSALASSVQRFGSPLRTLGFSLGEAAATFATFERAGVNTQTMVPGLKLALANLTKPTSDLGKRMDELGIAAGKPEKGLRQVFKLLGDRSNLSKTDKISLAMEVFGKRAGADMAEAIRQGRFEVDEMLKTFEGGGDTINKAEKDTRDFAEQWALLRNKIFVGLEPIANKVFDTIGDGMERLATADFGQIKADLGIDTTALEEDVRSATASIKSILQSDLVQFIGSNIVGGVKRSMQGVVQAFRGAFSSIAAILRALDDLLHLRFADAFGELDDIVKGGLRTAVGVFRAQTGPFREIASRLGTGIGTAFRGAWGRIKDIFSRGVSGALGVLRSAVGTAGNIGERIGSAIATGFKARIGLIRNVAESVVGIFKRIPSRLGSIGSGIFNAMKKGLSGRQLIPSFKINLPSPVPDVSFPGVKLPSFLKGGKQKKTSMALVGEEGPELVELPVGTRVHPHGKSKRMAKQMGIQAFKRGGTVKPDQVSAIANRWGVNRAVASIGAAVENQYPAMQIMSGFRPGSITSSGNLSNHARRAALDLGTGRNTGLNRRIGSWVRSMFTKAIRKATEDVLDIDHDPNPPDHADHVHVAAFGTKAIAKAMQTGADGGSKKPSITSGTKLSVGQVVTLAKRVGFPDPALAAAVAYAESRGKVGAVGDSGESMGLWQIHTPSHPKYDEDKLRTDAFYNAKAALSISKGGKNWKPWTQYRTGAYKAFLGAKGKPLPSGAGGGTGGSESKYADYLALWLEQAEGTKREERELNRGLRYWRKVYRRNKAGNPSRASEALQNIKTLRERKKELRTPPEESVFTLGGLSKIGKINVAGLQPTLDQIDNNIAKAALTETLDGQGNVTPASYEDDLAAAKHLVQIWNDLYNLSLGSRLAPTGGKWVQRKGKLGPKIKNKDGSTYQKGPGFDWVPEGMGQWNVGTRAQQTEAATSLKSARDALKSIQDEMKTEEGVTADTDTSAADAKAEAAREIKAFLAALGNLKSQFGSNFRPLQSFGDGGVVQGPKGKPQIIEAHGGEIVLPNGQRIPVDISRSREEKKVVNIDARSTFKEVPADAHTWSKNVAFELEAAI